MAKIPTDWKSILRENEATRRAEAAVAYKNISRKRRSLRELSRKRWPVRHRAFVRQKPIARLRPHIRQILSRMVPDLADLRYAAVCVLRGFGSPAGIADPFLVASTRDE